jgi:hypothetical protein
MNLQRLQLIKQIAYTVQHKKESFKGLERQAIQLSDLDYIKTDKKVVDSVSELDFN